MLDMTKLGLTPAEIRLRQLPQPNKGVVPPAAGVHALRAQLTQLQAERLDRAHQDRLEAEIAAESAEAGARLASRRVSMAESERRQAEEELKLRQTREAIMREEQIQALMKQGYSRQVAEVLVIGGPQGLLAQETPKPPDMVETLKQVNALEQEIMDHRRRLVDAAKDELRQELHPIANGSGAALVPGQVDVLGALRLLRDSKEEMRGLLDIAGYLPKEEAEGRFASAQAKREVAMVTLDGIGAVPAGPLAVELLRLKWEHERILKEIEVRGAVEGRKWTVIENWRHTFETKFPGMDEIGAGIARAMASGEEKGAAAAKRKRPAALADVGLLEIECPSCHEPGIRATEAQVESGAWLTCARCGVRSRNDASAEEDSP